MTSRGHYQLANGTRIGKAFHCVTVTETNHRQVNKTLRRGETRSCPPRTGSPGFNPVYRVMFPEEQIPEFPWLISCPRLCLCGTRQVKGVDRPLSMVQCLPDPPQTLAKRPAEPAIRTVCTFQGKVDQREHHYDDSLPRRWGVCSPEKTMGCITWPRYPLA